MLRILSEKLTAIAEKIAGSQIAAGVLLATLIMLFPAPPELDYDMWFHLAYGEHFVKNLTWQIDHSIFSWTPADAGWGYVTWIGSSLLYIFYTAGSMPGLFALRLLVLFAILVLCLLFLRRMGDKFDIAGFLGVLLVFTTLSLEAVFFKPELLTILYFSITAFIFFYSKQRARNLFFVYPLIFLLWVNTHGGFIFGLFFLSLLLFGEVANYLFVKNEALPRKLFIGMCSSVLVSFMITMINPRGLSYHESLLREFLQHGFLESSRVLLAYHGMWQYLFPEEIMYWSHRFILVSWAMLIMAGLAVILCIYLYRKKGYLDITVVAVTAAFFYWGMDISRMTLFYPLVWFFSSAYILKRTKSESLKVRFAAPLCICLVLFWGAVLYEAAVYTFPGRGLSVHSGPVREVAYMKQNRLPGPIFNDYLTGGYLMWTLNPEYRVFIDSRFGPYSQGVWQEYSALRADFDGASLDKLMSKYDFRTAFVSLEEVKILFKFLSSPEWRLLYFDTDAAVIVRKQDIVISPREPAAPDLSAERFKELDNPDVLRRLFLFYVVLHANKDGRAASNAAMIRNIYRNNVSGFYAFKDKDLRDMEEALRNRVF